jgi:hypothetical protein
MRLTGVVKFAGAALAFSDLAPAFLGWPGLRVITQFAGVAVPKSTATSVRLRRAEFEWVILGLLESPGVLL